MKYRASGESPLLGKSDINDIGKGVNQWNRWRATTGTEPTTRLWPTILLDNAVGAGIAPGEHVSIGPDLPWNPAWGESTQYLPQAVQATDQLVPAVAVGYVEEDRTGPFIVQGVCLAEVAAGEGEYGAIDGNTRIFKPTKTPGPVRLLGTPSTSAQTLLPVLLGATAGNAIIAKTPVEGIPAATGDGPYTWGSAECWVINEDSGVVTQEKETIYNLVDVAIGGSIPIKAELVGSKYFVDVASCPSSPPTGPVEPSGTPVLASINITSPPDQIGVTQSDVGFTGDAFDANLGDVSDQITWASNLDGTMGTGRSITYTFINLGAHLITASIVNAAGTNSDSITVNVIEDPPPV